MPCIIWIVFLQGCICLLLSLSFAFSSLTPINFMPSFNTFINPLFGLPLSLLPGNNKKMKLSKKSLMKSIVCTIGSSWHALKSIFFIKRLPKYQPNSKLWHHTGDIHSSSYSCLGSWVWVKNTLLKVAWILMANCCIKKYAPLLCCHFINWSNEYQMDIQCVI